MNNIIKKPQLAFVEPMRKLLIILYRRPQILIFLLVLVNSMVFIEWTRHTSNYTSRIYLTRAIVDEGTFKLDSYKKWLGYDQSLYQDHRMSNKAPGSSIMLLPQYILFGKPIDLITKRLYPNWSNNLFIEFVVLLTSLPFYSALSFVGLYRIFKKLGCGFNALPFTLSCFLCTLMFPYSTFGVGAMFAAPFVVWGAYFLLIGDDKNHFLAYAGACYGFVFLILNQAALFAVAGIIYILWKFRSWRSLILYCLPLAAIGSISLIYNYIAFGGLFSFPAAFTAPNGHPYENGGKALALYFALPTLKKLLKMFFYPNKGIFFYSPFLLLSLLGFYKMWKNNYREFSLFIFSAFFLYFGFFSCNKAWAAGANVGFRYIIPALPYLCIAAGAWIGSRKLHILEALFIAPGFILAFISSMGSVWISPKFLKQPYFGYIIPSLLEKGPRGILSQGLTYIGVENWYLLTILTALPTLTTALLVVSLWVWGRNSNSYLILNNRI